MLVRCTVHGYFYVEMPDNASPDDIEDEVGARICKIERSIENYMAIDEYGWDTYPEEF